MLFFSKKLDMITKEKMYMLYEIADALINVDRCQTHKKSVLYAQGSFVR